jgi:2-phospho-L-lactate guanylyltransferase
MTDIIIPIKDLSCAKQRLAGILSPSERAGLVLAMLEDLLATVTELDNGRVWLVAHDDAVFDIGRKFAALPIRENRPRGYNPAVKLGLSAVAANSNVAVLPGDLPLAMTAEIAELIKPANHMGPTIRLAAARDYDGTNGLFLSAKDLMRPAYGPQSFAGYKNTSRALGIEPTLLDAPGLSHDIDTVADFRDLLASATSGATYHFLQGMRGSAGNQTLQRGAA